MRIQRADRPVADRWSCTVELLSGLRSSFCWIEGATESGHLRPFVRKALSEPGRRQPA